jgi:hypothetical protein
MELEHFLRHPMWFLIMQMLMGSLLMPALIGRMDLYRSCIRQTASLVVTFGPFGLLVYVLYEVSKLS